MIDDHLDAFRVIATEIGYLFGDEPAGHIRQVVSLILMICEPLRYDGVYDFGSSDLMLRAQDAGLDLVFKSGHFRTPRPETIFLHRKFVGYFLLRTRIRARVDVQATIQLFLRSPQSGWSDGKVDRKPIDHFTHCTTNCLLDRP